MNPLHQIPCSYRNYCSRYRAYVQTTTTTDGRGVKTTTFSPSWDHETWRPNKNDRSKFFSYYFVRTNNPKTFLKCYNERFNAVSCVINNWKHYMCLRWYLYKLYILRLFLLNSKGKETYSKITTLSLDKLNIVNLRLITMLNDPVIIIFKYTRWRIQGGGQKL